MTESSPAAARCPLCERDNHCAIAAGERAAHCWCQSVAISAAARELAADTAGERCLCPSCGAPTGKSVEDSVEIAHAG